MDLENRAHLGWFIFELDKSSGVEKGSEGRDERRKSLMDIVSLDNTEELCMGANIIKSENSIGQAKNRRFDIGEDIRSYIRLRYPTILFVEAELIEFTLDAIDIGTGKFYEPRYGSHIYMRDFFADIFTKSWSFKKWIFFDGSSLCKTLIESPPPVRSRLDEEDNTRIRDSIESGEDD